MLATVAIALPAAAEPGDVTVVTVDSRGFLPGDERVPVDTLRIPSGSPLAWSNFDATSAHSFTSGYVDESGTARPDGVFDAALPTYNAGRGLNQKRIDGVEALSPGSYFFYCAYHPQMRGTLIVI